MEDGREGARGGQGTRGREGEREGERERAMDGGARGGREEAMMICRERVSVQEGRVEGGRVASEEGTDRGMDGARARGEGGSERRRD